MYILVGMLIVGLICNLLVTPVADKWFMTDAELATEKKLAHEKAAASEISASAGGGGGGTASATPAFMVALAWTAVGIPLAWGVYKTLINVGKFFN
jgi:hypothetical protein